jgi:hypothetical protein
VAYFTIPVRPLPAIVGLSVLLMSAACAGSSRSAGDPFRGSPSGGESGSAREIRIEVHNENFSGGTVYAVRSGNRRRLGRVEGGRDEEFKMPWSVSEQLSFEVDLLGRDGCVTRPLIVAPGQAVRLTIYSMARPRSDGYTSLCDVRGAR